MAACMEQPRALVLVEPPLFHLSAHRPASARLIERLEPIYLDASLTDATFEQAFRLAFEGRDLGQASAPDELRSSRRHRLHGAPWRHPVDARSVAETRTLVLTGGWSEEYEEVAEVLAGLGAAHEVLAGHGHRVIDHPDCSERIRAFVGAR
jgi:hypothetical protein